MPPSSPLDRREFLRRSIQIATLTAGAVGSSVLFDSCNGRVPRASPPTTVEGGPPTIADWSALRASLRGHIVLPSDRGYSTDRLLYNSKFVNLHPQGIAYCSDADDVARCVDFGTSHYLKVAARSGGHSYGGYSSCDGLVIDVGPMASIAVDTNANTAVVGAGAKLIDVYDSVGRHNRLLPGGSCPTVGIAGLTLGGGVGVFSRRYGMTSDNLRSARLVTADGRIVTADAHNNADLLWACQGGGGGNFGIVTSFEFTVHPMPQVTLFTLQYPWQAAATMLDAWQHWISAMPDELWSDCHMFAAGTSGYEAGISGVFCGSPSALASWLAPLERDIGSAPTDRFIGSNDYITAMEIEAGCSGLSVAACHLASQHSAGQLSRSPYSAKSSYVNGPMTTARVALMVEAVANLHLRAPTVGGGLSFDAYGGVINRVAPDRTAFVHRDKLACIQATYTWSSEANPSVVAAGEEWLSWLGANVFDPLSGAYQNYIDPTLADWQNAYYGSNLGKLTGVKSHYDPNNVFSFRQSIPPSP